MGLAFHDVVQKGLVSPPTTWLPELSCGTDCAHVTLLSAAAPGCQAWTLSHWLHCGSPAPALRPV